MLRRAVVEEHAGEAAHLWSLRRRAVEAPNYDLADMARMDERVEAHLDGLRLAGGVALEVCKAGLDEEEAGSAFAATAVAVERGDLPAIAEILDVAAAAVDLRRGMISALGWMPIEPVRAILPGLLDPACPQTLQLLGIAACSAHRVDPGGALANALHAEDAPLRARALRSAGELGRTNLMRALEGCLNDTDDGCRLAAAWSLTLLGGTEALPVLWSFAERGGRVGARAAGAAVRRADVQAAADKLRSLGGRRESFRLAVSCAGALGDPQLIPWLHQCMDLPDLARLAGEAFTMITGADLERERLQGKKPEGFEPGPSEDKADIDTEIDPDEDLPWPDVEATKHWWGAHRNKLRERTRHLLGKPISAPWLEHVLRQGTQRQRAAAAIELSMLTPGRPLFEVRAPAFRQVRALG